MTHYKAMVQLAVASGIPEDRPVNTFHFDVTNSTGIAAALKTALKDAYDEFTAQFASSVSQNGHRFKLYLMTDPEPRAPIDDSTFNFDSAPSGNPLPSEVALCVSFQGDRVSGQSQARRRGRIYLGPLDTGSCDTDGRPTTTCKDNALNFGDSLLAASTGQADWKWCVFSTVDDDLVQITDGWVDNSFDTQRRRGLAPTSRGVFN